MLHRLPYELVAEVGDRLCSGGDVALLLALAQTSRHTRASLLPLLYSSISIYSSSQLQLFVHLLSLLPQSHPLDPATRIRALRLGPRDTLASASETSHYFSSINFFPATTDSDAAEDGAEDGRGGRGTPSGTVDQRWVLTAKILERCAALEDLVIWDGLLGEPPRTSPRYRDGIQRSEDKEASLDERPSGLWALHPSARLQSLALPFLWRGGSNLPSPDRLPGLSDLVQLDIVNSGLTTQDIRILSRFPRLELFRWYYRPLGMIEIELLLDTLTSSWRHNGLRQEELQIFLVANSGMLAQIEGYLVSQTPGFVFVDPYLPLLAAPDSRVPSPDPPPRVLPPQVLPKQPRQRHPSSSSSSTGSERQPAKLDQYEVNFLFHRRRAGMQGFAPGAAPQLPQAWVDHLAALQAQSANQDPGAAPVQAPPILGGFPTESAEDQFARRIMEREKRLNAKAAAEAAQAAAEEPSAVAGEGLNGEAASSTRNAQHADTGTATETHPPPAAPSSPLRLPPTAAAETGTRTPAEAAAAAATKAQADETWISTAVSWYHSQRLVFERVRWKQAITAWEDEWDLASEPDDEDDEEGVVNTALEQDEQLRAAEDDNSVASSRRRADVRVTEVEHGLETLLLSQLADL